MGTSDPAPSLVNDPPYESVVSPAARRVLEEHFDTGGNLYMFWGSPLSVLRTLAFGWARSSHPGHIHYAWDLDHARSLDDGVRETVRRAIALLALDGLTAPRLYEPGCGIGGPAMQVARMLPHASVVGMSLVPGQLAIGRARIAAQALANAALCCGNYLAAPFAAESFDGIYALETLVYTPPAERAGMFREMFRVLAPGGRFVCFDGVLLRPPATVAERGYVQDVVDGWTLPVPTTAEEFRSNAQAAGFEMIRQEDATSRIYTSAKRIAAVAASVLLPLSMAARAPLLRGLLAPLGFASPRHAQRFGAACRSQVRVFEQGLGAYYVHVMGKPA